MSLRCTSCNAEVTDDYVKFKCPSCLKQEIVRCYKCREIVTKYKCPSCEYIGP